MLNKYLASRFNNGNSKSKTLKKISALMNNNWQALDIFDYLIERAELKKSITMSIDPSYAFLKNGQRVLNSAGKLSDCFTGWVSPTELVIIRTGERTGEYEKAFQQCIDLDYEIKSMVKTVKKSLIMPIVSIFIMIGVLIGARHNVIPMLLDLVELKDWPEVATNFYGIAESIGGNPVKTLGILFAMAVFLKWSIPNLVFNKIPAIRKYMDVLLPFKIYKQIQISIFLKSMSSMLEAGVRLKDTLSLIEENTNKYVKLNVQEFIHKLNKGEDESTIFLGDFLGDIGEDLSALAKGSNLEKAMDDIANETVKTVMEDLPARMSFIGTVCMLSVVSIVIMGLLAFYDIVGVLQSA